MQDGELVAQRQDLNILVLIAHRQQPQQREGVRHAEVGQPQKHERSSRHAAGQGSERFADRYLSHRWTDPGRGCEQQDEIIGRRTVRAARGETIRHLTLDDLDLARNRITVAGQRRPFGELTRAVFLDYPSERRSQWPHAANRHVVISMQSANGTGPVSTSFIKRPLALRRIRLERIRIDRCLHEALATGAGALHLAVLFNLHPPTVARYAACARRILHDTLLPEIDRSPVR